MQSDENQRKSKKPSHTCTQAFHRGAQGAEPSLCQINFNHNTGTRGIFSVLVQFLRIFDKSDFGTLTVF